MNPYVSLLLCAALFALWGLEMRLARRPTGCGGCTTDCPTKEARRERR